MTMQKRISAIELFEQEDILNALTKRATNQDLIRSCLAAAASQLQEAAREASLIEAREAYNLSKEP